MLVAEAGTFVFVPRGINHTWRNAVLRRSRMILTYVPGGIQSFFQEAAPLMHATTPEPGELEEVNDRHGTRMVASGRVKRRSGLAAPRAHKAWMEAVRVDLRSSFASGRPRG